MYHSHLLVEQTIKYDTHVMFIHSFKKYDQNYTTQIQRSELDPIILSPECLY